MTGDWTTVIPAPGDVPATARALLALARDPGDVRTRRGGTEFLIPPYLADLYTKPPAPRKRAAKQKEGDE